MAIVLGGNGEAMAIVLGGNGEAMAIVLGWCWEAIVTLYIWQSTLSAFEVACPVNFSLCPTKLILVVMYVDNAYENMSEHFQWLTMSTAIVLGANSAGSQ